jgi:hypothetical protein
MAYDPQYFKKILHRVPMTTLAKQYSNNTSSSSGGGGVGGGGGGGGNSSSNDRCSYNNNNNYCNETYITIYYSHSLGALTYYRKTVSCFKLTVVPPQF